MPRNSEPAATVLSSGFPPVAGRAARVLILGSLPGARSIEAQQYYAQPQNAFWRIMGELAGAGPALSYARRLRQLKRHGIALWDVVAAAERPGSLDAAIVPESVQPNDFAAFFARHSQLRRIYFNGAKAEELYRRLVIPRLAAPAAAIATQRMPSTSAAHARMRYAEKLAAWSAITADLMRADTR